MRKVPSFQSVKICGQVKVMDFGALGAWAFRSSLGSWGFRVWRLEGVSFKV